MSSKQANNIFGWNRKEPRGFQKKRWHHACPLAKGAGKLFPNHHTKTKNPRPNYGYPSFGLNVSDLIKIPVAEFTDPVRGVKASFKVGLKGGYDSYPP